MKYFIYHISQGFMGPYSSFDEAYRVYNLVSRHNPTSIILSVDDIQQAIGDFSTMLSRL